MIAYKVVQLINGTLYSAISILVEYKQDERVYPEFGKLFVFPKLEMAERYFNDIKQPDRQIWECEVPNLLPMPFVAGWSVDGDYLPYYKEFWEEEHYKKGYHDWTWLLHAPEGTYVTDWVKLTRRIS